MDSSTNFIIFVLRSKKIIQMNISYNWLQEYINIDMPAEEIGKVLTSIGLEVGSIGKYEKIKGGLKGMVVGKVLTCHKHPNADKLSVTTVDIGTGDPLKIVCGAPNVAAGQKVIIATVGTVLNSGNESFTIKRSKIRGEESEGMICASDEIGVGDDHSGIIVLPQDVTIGTTAASYFGIETDNILEVDITPNRIDSACHIGIARDLAASLKTTWNLPDISGFTANNSNNKIKVSVLNTEACIRYSGVCISNVKVQESPDWLKHKLLAIGLNPINNIVDITNFVLHECNQPLHAFDAAKITGNTVIVQTVSEGTEFITLDGNKRKLTANDLMICNANEPMCIAGVFGGADSGVSNDTTEIFLESACFHPVWVRKTARRHQLNTDSSFRFERGTDPNNVLYALKRAALLICNLAGGVISSEVTDIYPNIVEPVIVDLDLDFSRSFLGKDIDNQVIISTLQRVEIETIAQNNNSITVKIPTYKVDVTRPVDVIEEFLRIYGFNEIEINDKLHSTLSFAGSSDSDYRLKNTISELLTSNGFNEIMCNSLTKAGYYESLNEYRSEHLVKILNPLSSDLNVMRQTLLFGGMESVQYNKNRRKNDICFYEFGNCYLFKESDRNENSSISAYSENQSLGIWISGKKNIPNWKNQVLSDFDFYDLKSHVFNIMRRLGIQNSITFERSENELFDFSLNVINLNSKKIIGTLGRVSSKQNLLFDIESPIYFCELNWDLILKLVAKSKVTFGEISKFPEVKRDLALLIDAEINYSTLEAIAFQTEKKILKSVSLFDVYEGKNIPNGKKSYALSFILQDNDKTLNDTQIEKTMDKILQSYSNQVSASLR